MAHENGGRAIFLNYFMTFLIICNRYPPRNTAEGVKKLVHCASAHRVGGFVQALEGGVKKRRSRLTNLCLLVNIIVYHGWVWYNFLIIKGPKEERKCLKS